MNKAGFWLLLVASVTLVSFADADACPPCETDRVCETDLVCEDGKVIKESLSICDCCPGCTYVLGLGAFCSPTFGPLCDQGLECDEDKRVCVYKKGTCLAFTNPMWKPDCLPDGQFAPKQCKGERLTGRCFCYGGDGTRIFGHERWTKADKMTCSCSRRVWELEKEGRTDVTLHCNDLGNYEPLQCDRGLCWCAEEMTGNPITPIVPENVLTALPCYNKTTVGSQYLRQCESVLVGQSRIAQVMLKHGTIYDLSNKIKCDPDGSYGNYQIDEYGRCYCSWKDSSGIGAWAIEYAAMEGINCNCARDYKWYADQGETLSLACSGNGNYEKRQISGNSFYCVDSDGFPRTELYPSVDCDTI